jgi:purine-nucleoside phosphorylase
MDRAKKKTDRPLVLGSHTPASPICRSGYSKAIPLLDMNDGKFPPNMIVVGSRVRVLDAADALKLNPRADLHELSASYKPLGRVNLVIGTFEMNGKLLPLSILETQMGCSAQEINAKEVLSMMDVGPYNLPDGNVLNAKTLRVIRAGTCGGINAPSCEPELAIGDVAIGSKSYGWVGSSLQNEHGPDYVLKIATDAINNALNGRSEIASKDLLDSVSRHLSMPYVHSSRDLIEALQCVCNAMGLRHHTGANHTKDSLYMEADEDQIIALRAEKGILSTEMEHFGLAMLAREFTESGIPTETALVSTVVGTIPGGSFAEPGSKEETDAKWTETRMLIAAARALHKLSYG